ncbi:hypothetical protein Daus18300_005502 [Diaporthe australafricana]|uniref:Uncharacterized protein n=1 Tax=Diaporthe australafricana TaxID=127596 RepID=A0ABR3X1P9_9PEZI
MDIDNIFGEETPVGETGTQAAPGGNDESQADNPGPETRQEVLAAKTSVQSRKRKRPVARPAAEMFLYHRYSPDVKTKLVAQVYGEGFSAETWEAQHVHEKMIDDQRNHKSHVLTNMKEIILDETGD